MTRADVLSFALAGADTALRSCRSDIVEPCLGGDDHCCWRGLRWVARYESLRIMNPSESPELAPGKACGTCMMCCKLPLIEELNKPIDRWCRHAVPGKGCGIYTDRPPV